MNSAEWKFRKMSRGEINVDPIEGEFFTTEALGSLSDALIREAIQNSLDAGIPGEQVKINISFCPPDLSLQDEKQINYLNGLLKHLSSRHTGLINSPMANEPMDYIVIEDFGTRGLEGEISQDEDLGDKWNRTKNDFFYFWRNIGRAVEGTTARGRWGLGKTVFQAASRINSFFGLSIRMNDPRKLLMGQSVLKIHRLDNQRFAPYGYYGVFDNGFALPVDDEELIKAFCEDFHLQRKDQSGLSVLIPYPEKEIKPKSIIMSAIHHYFFPILSNDLSITVQNGKESHVLDAESIFPFLDHSDWPDKDMIRRRLELAVWGIHTNEDDHIRINEPEEGKSPKWDQELFEPGLLKELRTRFDKRIRIPFRVPLWVKKSNEKTAHSFFKVYVERDEYAEKGEDHFIRDGVTIAGVSSMRHRGIRVLVSVSDDPLSRFLGDSENPAHTEWQERSQKFRGKYDWGPTCLRYVKNSPREIVRILSRPAKGRDETLLKDFFYIDVAEKKENDEVGKSAGEMPGEDGKEKSPPKDISNDLALRLRRIKGGFKLDKKPDADAIPRFITIQIAYDVRQGNPFKRYQPFDFSLSEAPIRMRGKGVKASIVKPNALRLFIENPKFILTVTGFDPNRDLKVKTLRE
jgi:hypothetical protein